MDGCVLDLREVDQAQAAVVGGKAAHLGALTRIAGVRVPAGFCVTTDGFRRIMQEAPSVAGLLGQLARVDPDDMQTIRTRSAEIRQVLEATAVPDEVAAAITAAVVRFGERAGYAVRSSATAEDLPSASFAGQQDTYLNVVGPTAVIEHVRRCWASLFTERAVRYRLRNGFDHRSVGMAVIVQQMVFPQASGVLFTADPVTSNRRVASVEAVYGLGEALVAGRVNADVHVVCEGEIVSRAITTKQRAVHASPAGGTHERPIVPDRQAQAALTDAQVVQLVQLGRRIEERFGSPQDIEWCLDDGGFQIVQSRPITTLFPVPEVDDGENHVYVSVGHQQMMTDAMKPLGMSLWKLTARPPMHEAGGRLFVDVTGLLASPASRAGILELLGRSDPLIRDALETVLERGDFLPSLPEGAVGPAPGGTPVDIEPDPAIVTELIEQHEASVAALAHEIQTKSGSGLLAFILEDIQELRRLLFDPHSHEVFTAAMDATWWLNEQLHEWLGEKNAADVLTQSVPHNVTSEMGLALLDVADVIRPHPAVVDLLRHVEDDDFLDELETLEGGREARDAIVAYLDRYGMRCVGEIDITRPRWREQPSVLVPMILSNVENFEQGAGERRFEQGRREALAKAHELLARVAALPDGDRKAEETKRRIDLVRTFIGYREYPKYGMVCRYSLYKQALLAEARRLVEADVLRAEEDIFFLTFQELQDVLRANEVDDDLIRRRMDAFAAHQRLRPPRVLTSDGEAITGTYRRDGLPSGALVGLPVSAGTVQGRARVILDMADADLEPGDILVTAYTDPSWTPLFVAIAALVTEVGGLMTHGAVIAREYGLPAVVGVERATQLIDDGQMIRVDGTDGYIEILTVP